jgi:diaminopimelate decarboxylase
VRIFLQKSAIPLYLSNKNKLNFSSNDRCFFDKTALIKQIKKWDNTLHWIQPFYAIKANPCDEMIKTIMNPETILNNKIGFDSASVGELHLALKYTKLSKNIIYTNPHIIPHEKNSMSELLPKINVKVVDNLCELKKLIEYEIKSDILIRLISNIYKANVQFDTKFGCTNEEAFEIIKYAEKHNIKIKGISFHIGSGGNFSRKDSYEIAIQYADQVLKYLEIILKDEKPILDIGGGLVYDTNLEEALGWTKELSQKYIMISELGRYYAEPSYHLAVQIIGQTKRGVYLDNGLYHELNVYNWEKWRLPKLTHYYDTNSNTIEEVKEFNEIKIFGPTCDSMDTINECEFPNEFEIGDWIFLHNMGAYTSAGKVDFNGIKGASNNICHL